MESTSVTSMLLIAVFGILALVLALALAFVPLRLMMYAIAKGTAARVREFIKRQTERRTAPRESTDRRKSE